MPATIEKIEEFLRDPGWDEGEKFIIKAQFRFLGGFESALWACIKQADDGNLARLRLGFPDQVDGYESWVHGDLGSRLRTAGLDI